MNKGALFEALVVALKAELTAAARIARDSADAANHPEARPENDKDTRKVELSYLAAGQAARVRELEAAIAAARALLQRPREPGAPIAAGAVATLSVSGKPQRVIVSPAGGGLRLDFEGASINVVTPQSPLGRALLGKLPGDSFELVVAGRTSEVEVLAVD